MLTKSHANSLAQISCRTLLSPFARGGKLSGGCICRDQCCEERVAEGRLRGDAVLYVHFVTASNDGASPSSTGSARRSKGNAVERAVMCPYKMAWRTSPRLIGWGRPSGSWYSVCGA